MIKGKISKLILTIIILSLCACGPSQEKLNGQTVQAGDTSLAIQVAETPTQIPTTEAPTPIPASETPVPAKFINPPEFMEERFRASSGWMWLEAVEGRRSAFQESENYNTTFYLVYENNMIGVGETGKFSDVFINFVLEQFVPDTTRMKIVQIRDDYSEPGTYQNIIDGFVVSLEIFGSNDNYFLDIYESK